MALVGSAVEGVTSYVFTMPSISTATLCTPSQLPSAGTGAGDGFRGGIQPRGGEDDGCAFRPFRQKARFVLRAGGE